MLARASLTALVGTCAMAVAACGGSSIQASSTGVSTPLATTTSTTSTTAETSTAATRPPPPPRPPHAPFAVGERVVTFIDQSRTVRQSDGALVPRKLVTVIRYPAKGSPQQIDVPGAPPERAGGPHPLVIFGHGFAVTPTPYAPLLRAWAQAGYVVAAPIFPLENADAPGGPNEADLVNQPRDMSFVISRMIAASEDRGSALAGLVDPHEIAVTGQSDGGETALAVAYDRYYLDRRVAAAVILSGAEIPGVGGFDFPAPSPPLLATQGTADTINPPSFTQAFFDLAPAPKFLLNMFGAPHLGPYTDEQPQLGIVERVTIAFLDRYLKGGRRALRRMIAAGDQSGISVLQVYR